jgi:polyisoprenoid-binding protein YceI
MLLVVLPALLLSQAERFAVDPEETELIALTSPAGLFGGASHPHVIAAQKVRGEVVTDAAAPERSSVWLEFQAKDLTNDDPVLRRRFHMGSVLSPDDRRTVAANMVAADQLDVKAHPTVSFKSRRVRGLDGEHLEVSGTMTLRGVTAELTLPVKVTVRNGVLRAEGTASITHAMFGFKPYSTALGAIRNDERITLELRIVARAVVADGGS